MCLVEELWSLVLEWMIFWVAGPWGASSRLITCRSWKNILEVDRFLSVKFGGHDGVHPKALLHRSAHQSWWLNRTSLSHSYSSLIDLSDLRSSKKQVLLWPSSPNFSFDHLRVSFLSSRNDELIQVQHLIFEVPSEHPLTNLKCVLPIIYLWRLCRETPLPSSFYKEDPRSQFPVTNEKSGISVKFGGVDLICRDSFTHDQRGARGFAFQLRCDECQVVRFEFPGALSVPLAIPHSPFPRFPLISHRSAENSVIDLFSRQHLGKLIINNQSRQQCFARTHLLTQQKMPWKIQLGDLAFDEFDLNLGTGWLHDSELKIHSIFLLTPPLPGFPSFSLVLFAKIHYPNERMCVLISQGTSCRDGMFLNVPPSLAKQISFIIPIWVELLTLLICYHSADSQLIATQTVFFYPHMISDK